jgi:hypothetical protein
VPEKRSPASVGASLKRLYGKTSWPQSINLGRCRHRNPKFEYEERERWWSICSRRAGETIVVTGERGGGSAAFNVLVRRKVQMPAPLEGNKPGDDGS